MHRFLWVPRPQLQPQQQASHIECLFKADKFDPLICEQSSLHRLVQPFHKEIPDKKVSIRVTAILDLYAAISDVSLPKWLEKVPSEQAAPLH